MLGGISHYNKIRVLKSDSFLLPLRGPYLGSAVRRCARMLHVGRAFYDIYSLSLTYTEANVCDKRHVTTYILIIKYFTVYWLSL